MNEIGLRKFPYPYRAALTICSDIDETDSVEEFVDIQRFLNTKDNTSVGTGVGLEVGNSFFMFDHKKRFSYFSGRTLDREVIRRYIDAGLLDSIHCYGSKPDFTREDAKIALTELNALQRRIDVWIDHSREISNLGSDVMGGMGDVRQSPAYHSDLTVGYGFRYFWLGRLTSAVTLESPIGLDTFAGIFDGDHPVASFIAMSKEFGKHILAVFGSEKYAMHRDYRLLRLRSLRDGQKVFEFIRSDSHWKGVGMGADSIGLSCLLSKRNLRNLIRKHAYVVVYTHLGINAEGKEIIAEETRDALRNLAQEFESGNILVTTTSKLLNYYVTRKYLSWEVEARPELTRIKISGAHDPVTGKMLLPDRRLLQGITFYVPDPARTHVFLGMDEVRGMKINPPDDTGRESIMFPLLPPEKP
jgi:hypothetical protein